MSHEESTPGLRTEPPFRNPGLMIRNATPATGQLCHLQGCSDLPSSSPFFLPIPEKESTALFDLNLSRAGKRDMLNPKTELAAPGKHTCPLGDPSPESSSELETAVLPREL